MLYYSQDKESGNAQKEVINMTKKDLKIKEAIEEMCPEEIIMLHNNYCEACNGMDNYIYSMDNFDEIMSGTKPWEIARAAFYGTRFNPNDDYFYFNGYGNLESLAYAEDAIEEIIFIDDISEYIAYGEDPLDNDTLIEILEETEE